MTKEKTCTWTSLADEENNYFDTSCNEIFFFVDGGVQENKFKWCPYCGGKLITDFAEKEK